MPYRWTSAEESQTLRLWPHRSLTPRGFVAFFGITAALVAVPLVAILGSPVLWMILPFVALTFWAAWAAIARNTRDGARLSEELVLAPDRIALTHRPLRGPVSTWEANPHWVRLAIRPEGGPVPDYLTLRGGGREVELGAFLSDGERRALHADLAERLARLGSPAADR